jgi:hypothetical protein
MPRSSPARHARLFLLLTFTATSWGQTVPHVGLQYLENVSIPNWTTSGSTQANFDLFYFNPATRIMYVADRTNHSVTAIDTRANVAIGSMVLPGNPSTNGVLVALDLQQLVVTDGKTNAYVWDLRLPGSGPDVYVIPNITGGTDAMEYDPLNQTVYLINGTAPYYITGINLAYKTIASQLALPTSPELNAFNPNDGLIYQVTTDSDNKNQGAGVIVYDPAANAIVTTYLTPNCVGHGIAIDSVSNVALIGCGTNQGQVMMNLKDGTILKQFADVTGTDLLVFNPNNRRFYTGSSGNQSTTTGCSADSTSAVPVVGVFEAPLVGGVPVPKMDGVVCVGRGAKVGIDPTQNVLYVGSRQYPVDPGSGTTGAPGVQLFFDPAPAQPLTTQSIAVLKSVGTATAQGTVRMSVAGRRIRLSATPTGVIGTSALMVVTTTVGNETVPCAVNKSAATAICGGSLLGDPLIGGVATLAVDGAAVARGTIVAGSGS